MTETLGMIVHRLKIKTYKVLEVYGIFVRFDKIFMGSVFLGHLEPLLLSQTVITQPCYGIIHEIICHFSI